MTNRLTLLLFLPLAYVSFSGPGMAVQFAAPPRLSDPFRDEDPFGDSPFAHEDADERESADLLEEDEGDDQQQQAVSELVQKYLRFDSLSRTAADVLRAQAGTSQLSSQPPGAEDPAQQQAAPGDVAATRQVQLQLVQGDWSAIKRFLAGLPPEASPAAYSFLLNLIAEDETAVLLPDDLLPLADASPVALDERQLRVLGKLLRRACSCVETPQTFFDRLDSGVGQLGGQEAANRTRAAQLLIHAGFVEPAAKFLPPLGEAFQSGDLKLLDLHALHQIQLNAQNHQPQPLLHAWLLSQRILDDPAADARLRGRATDRVLMLLPQLPAEVTVPWLHHLVSSDRAGTLDLLARASKTMDAAFAANNLSRRTQGLHRQQLLVGQLIKAVDDIDTWRTPIELVTLGWINEAQKTLGDPHRKMVKPNDEKIRPLPVPLLLQFAPDPAWRSALPLDTTRHVSRLTGLLAAQVADQQRVFEIIRECISEDAEMSQEIAEALVANFEGGQPELDLDEGNSPFGSMSFRRSRQSASNGMPLTRAKQVRNLARLFELLEQLQQLGLRPIAEEIVVDRFAACHSPAEVYLQEDLERVFGPVDQIRPRVIETLVTDMRLRLAQQWRSPDLQQVAGTNRTDQQLVAELNRGYDLAYGLLQGAMQSNPADIEARLLAGTLRFDLAEFSYGNQVDLATYVALREEAFALYRQAAELYVQSLPQRPVDQYDVRPFLQWFQSALGASDLAYLTRQDRPDKDQIDQLADMLKSMDDETARQHLQLLGVALTDSIDELPPQLKPHFLREGLRILGDHPSGQDARELLQYYDELLTEVTLHLETDGPTNVGYGHSFGAWLSIRHTLAAGRETGGFGYLLEETYSRATDSYYEPREMLEQEIKEKFSEAFQVEAIRFLEATVLPRAFGRDGWRETPLAYLVLSAKDPSVDRIPSLQMDLEFVDNHNVVLLPIVSQTILIDAKNAQPDIRPVRDIKIEQLLDDRRLSDEGLMTVEVTATGKGLIPKIEQLVDLDTVPSPGMTIQEVVDQGLDVTSIDMTGDRPAPLCQRHWVLRWTVDRQAPITEFRFPAPRQSVWETVYQRFNDADIVAIGPVVQVDSAGSSGGFSIFWSAVAAAGLLLLVAVAVWLVRRRGARTISASRYQRPGQITPFNVLVLLQRIEQDDQLDLSPQQRMELRESIGQLDRHYFGRHPAADLDETELVSLADHWVRVGTGATT